MFFFELISTVLALTALWIAYLAFRASCKIWVQIKKVGGGSSISVYEEGHHHLDVVIQNLGVPLHQVGVSLCFRSRDGETCTLAMQRVKFRERHKVVTEKSEFAQGMMGAFRLKSTELSLNKPFGIHMLSKLECPKRCNAKLHVYSQDFLVAEFRLWHRFYWIKSVWNRFASKVNVKFDREVTVSDGTIRLKHGKILPMFNIDSQRRLEYFVQDTLRENLSINQDEKNS